MKEQKVSVIVPIYNVELYLDRCIQSIIEQTYCNLEIILVNDGSLDNCPRKCDEWAAKDGRIKVIHKPNGGLSDARNAGMALASGRYISFIDSDDWIAPQFIEKLVESIEKQKSDIACCSVQMVWENSNSSSLLTSSENCVLNNMDAQRELLLEGKLKQPVWYKLYKKELVENIPFEKGKYHEDVFWSYQVIGGAANVSVIDYVGYFYWQRNNSIMGEEYSVKRLDAMEAYCKRYLFLKRHYPALEEKALISIWEKCLYHGQKILVSCKAEDKESAKEILTAVCKRYPLPISYIKNEKFTQKVWLCMAKAALFPICRIRNFLKIGV